MQESPKVVARAEGGWSGLRGHVSAWFVYGPLGRLSGRLIGSSTGAIVDLVAKETPEARSLLDVGAGWGYTALAIAERLPKADLTCVDSEQMLGRLRQEAEKQGLSQRVTTREGSAYQLPLEDGSVDVAMSQDVFHELKRPAAALQEMVRVLRQGGRAVIADMRGDTLVGRLNAAHHGPGAHGAWPPDEMQRLLTDAGLQRVGITTYRQAIIGTGVKPGAS